MPARHGPTSCRAGPMGVLPRRAVVPAVPCLHGLRAWPMAHGTARGSSDRAVPPVGHGHFPRAVPAHSPIFTKCLNHFFIFTSFEQDSIIFITIFTKAHKFTFTTVPHNHKSQHKRKDKETRLYENDDQKELFCAMLLSASLKTFLGKTHPCEKP